MKIINVKGTKKKLKYKLCKELHNKVFHVTSPIGYEGIIKDKAIYPSNHKNIKKHIWGFSQAGRYFTNINCVSLVDLYNNTDKKLLNEAINSKYRFFDIHVMAQSSTGYIFVIKMDLYNELIIWNDIREDWLKNLGQQIVPHLESGIKNQILLSDIEYIIKVETIEKYGEEYYTKLLSNKGNK